MKEKNNSKKGVAVQCFYNEKGKEAAELIKNSFLLFVKSEMAKATN